MLAAWLDDGDTTLPSSAQWLVTGSTVNGFGVVVDVVVGTGVNTVSRLVA